jgi:hypothetical protein
MDTYEAPATPPDEHQPPQRRRRVAAGAGLVAAGLVAGGVLANTLGASADTTSPTSSSSSSSSTSGERPNGSGNPGGSAPVRSDEKGVTAAQAKTLKAAALKAVPGGTVIRVETDAGDAAYEAHMRKADGTLVTVKFDKNLAVVKVESGMGQGDPAGAGGPGGHGGGGGAPAGESGA